MDQLIKLVKGALEESELRILESEEYSSSEYERLYNEVISLLYDFRDKGNPLSIYKKISIEDLNLSVRTYNCLKRSNHHNVYDLLRTYFVDGKGGKFIYIRNMGVMSREELFKTINPYIEEAKKICNL